MIKLAFVMLSVLYSVCSAFPGDPFFCSRGRRVVPAQGLLGLFKSCDSLTQALREKKGEGVIQSCKVEEDKKMCLARVVKSVRCAVQAKPAAECIEEINQFLTGDYCEANEIEVTSSPHDGSSTKRPAPAVSDTVRSTSISDAKENSTPVPKPAEKTTSETKVAVSSTSGPKGTVVPSAAGSKAAKTYVVSQMAKGEIKAAEILSDDSKAAENSISESKGTEMDSHKSVVENPTTE